MNDTQNNNIRMLKRKDVEQMTALKRSRLYAMTAAGKFPKPIKLSERSVAWIESEIQAWINDRIAASRGGLNHE
jgi:prophage regulatory protein